MQCYLLFGNRPVSQMDLFSRESVVFINFIHNFSQNLELITYYLNEFR
jgi:hypothetical protein